MKNLFTSLFLLIFSAAVYADLPKINQHLGEAQVTTNGNMLIVSTGQFERHWELLHNGLATRKISFGHSNKQGDSSLPDWNYPGWIDHSEQANLVALTVTESDDNAFTHRHLNVVAEFDYPNINTQIRYQIWVYPGAQGVRTQLWVKGEPTSTKGLTQVPQLELLKGKAVKNGYVGGQQLAFRIKALAANKTYRAKIYVDEKVKSKQTVVLTSLDNEFRITLDQKLTATNALTFELPDTLRPDGTVTLLVNSDDTDNTSVRQIEVVQTDKSDRSEHRVIFPKTVNNNRAVQTSRVDSAMRARVDFVPVTSQKITAAGYYNDTQHRHTLDTPLIKEQLIKSNSQVDWASLLFVEDQQSGFMLVKESPKCVNQTSVDTGQFIITPDGVETTGWGIARTDISPSEWRWAWATWSISYHGADRAQRELALKQFHRTRYPVDAALDLYTKANTWGSGNGGSESKQFAKESEVLAEIKSVAALGLDTLQIDDGWQSGRMPGKKSKQEEWQVRPDWYPQGWQNVVNEAKKHDISLGIWHAARAPLKDLKRNYDQGQFTTWKLDFANLSKYSGAFSYLNKARALIEHSAHQLRVNWDVTENAPRFGYYWASEAGNLWLANRKPETPVNVIPHPDLMLREVWQIARYLNLNKIELPVINFSMVNQHASDAHLHSLEYATALGLPGIPVFFQTTRFLTTEQRHETKGLLDIYKQHRVNLFNSYVFPIGVEPNGKAITGFQWFNPNKPDESYVLLFRERLSQQSQTRIPLNFLPSDKTWRVDNLLNKVEQHIKVAQRHVQVSMPTAGDVAFIKIVQSR